jgi:CRISPR-associated protein Cmr6
MSRQLQGNKYTRRKPLRPIKIDVGVEPHAGLWFDKFVTEQDKQNKEVRRSLIIEVSKIAVPESYKRFYERWEKMLDDYKQAGYAIERREAKVRGRLIIGTGNESVLETAVTLHRTYGVPYIPGSALKGLAATYARQYGGEHWHKDSENYKIVFGETDKSGCMIFFDALCQAASESPLHIDVLTPHHRDYYMNSDRPPADWDDPNPVHFLSATGTYLIALAASKGGDDWLNAVIDILQNALSEIGIGAKTSSGYGRLQFK